jgi:hypothetical protein
MSVKGLVVIALLIGVVVGLTLPGRASKASPKLHSQFSTLALS